MKKVFRIFFIGILWLGIWQLLYLAVGLDILFPSPWHTAAQIFTLFQEAAFWQSVTYSMVRIILGFLLGLLAGTLLAVLTCAAKWFADFVSPLLSIIKATPVASFIVLALVWMNKGTVPIFTSFLIVFPLVWANMAEGISSCDKNLLEMAGAFQMKARAKLQHIYIPAVLPYFSAAATTSLGMAWKAGIAAEVIAAPLHSIGKGIYNAKIYLNTTELFAWTVVIIILSIALEKIMIYFLRRRAVE